MMITVIGRGHSGTRAMSKTLSDSGVFMGAKLNDSADLVPPDDLYEACCVMARYVDHLGGLRWDFSKLHTGKIDPSFTKLVNRYLDSVLKSKSPNVGWKLPETTLILPWIVRMFPDIRYIYWSRDPRDCIRSEHMTDDLSDFGVPYTDTNDKMLQRAISYQYQYELMRSTPSPKYRIDVRFEDFVMKQDETIQRLEGFLGFPLVKVPVKADAVGRWRQDANPPKFDFFPKESLYEGP